MSDNFLRIERDGDEILVTRSTTEFDMHDELAGELLARLIDSERVSDVKMAAIYDLTIPKGRRRDDFADQLPTNQRIFKRSLEETGSEVLKQHEKLPKELAGFKEWFKDPVVVNMKPGTPALPLWLMRMVDQNLFFLVWVRGEEFDLKFMPGFTELTCTETIGTRLHDAIIEATVVAKLRRKSVVPPLFQIDVSGTDAVPLFLTGKLNLLMGWTKDLEVNPGIWHPTEQPEQFNSLEAVVKTLIQQMKDSAKRLPSNTMQNLELFLTFPSTTLELLEYCRDNDIAVKVTEQA